MDGVSLCARYSFGPNRLHYCGPDASGEVLAYLKAGVADPGLEKLLSEFQTLYPYLKLIAQANNIADPFNPKVVEAYWIGNSLLERVSRQEFYNHLVFSQRLKHRLGAKEFRRLEDKIARYALPHHSFHVFNIWQRTGHLKRLHTLESMDACRISWGKVLSVDGPKITVSRRPIVYSEGKLFLAQSQHAEVTRQLEAAFDIEQLRPGAIISMHWNAPCEVISQAQAQALERYTLISLAFANQTL
jgi:hypothetical protein